MRRPLFAASVLTTLAIALGTPREARAQDSTAAPTPTTATGFGRRSSVVLGVDNVLGYTNEGFTDGGGTIDDKGFFAGMLGPRLGFDVVSPDGVTFGSGVQLFRVHIKGADDDITLAGLAPRIGFAIPLAGILSAWGRVGPHLLFAHSDETQFFFSLRLEAFFVVTIAPHFGAMLGPSFDIGIASTRTHNNDTPSESERHSKWKAQDMLIGLFGEL